MRSAILMPISYSLFTNLTLLPNLRHGRTRSLKGVVASEQDAEARSRHSQSTYLGTRTTPVVPEVATMAMIPTGRLLS